LATQVLETTTKTAVTEEQRKDSNVYIRPRAGGTCPDCGVGKLIPEGRCLCCTACAWSACAA
jgi:hypothetical protein